jgi:hypothetical protein
MAALRPPVLVALFLSVSIFPDSYPIPANEPPRISLWIAQQCISNSSIKECFCLKIFLILTCNM